MKRNDGLYMDDVLHANVVADHAIEEELKNRGVMLTPEQLEWLSDEIWVALEQLSNGNYRSHQ